MASAFGKQFSKDTLDDKFGGSGTLYVALHADDPGVDGGGGSTEFTGSGYLRAVVAEGDWADAIVSGTYVIKSNANAITFPEALGTWAAGNPATWYAVWKSSGGTSEADFVFRAPLNTPTVVSSSNVPYFAPGDLQVALDNVA